MPRAKRICSQPGCPVLVDQGRCPEHTPTTKQRGYSGEHQRRRRADQQLMEQQGYLICRRCGERIEHGELWDEGHDDDDRAVWRGPEHANRCNRKAASRKAHDMINEL